MTNFRLMFTTFLGAMGIQIAITGGANAQPLLQDAVDACIKIASLVAEGDDGSITFNENQVQVNPTGEVQIYRGDQVQVGFTFDEIQNCVVTLFEMSDDSSGEKTIDLNDCRAITGSECENITNSSTTVTQMLDANHPENSKSVFGFFVEENCKITLSFRREDKLGFGFYISLRTETDSQLIHTNSGTNSREKSTEVGPGVYYLTMRAQDKYGNDGSGLKRIGVRAQCFG